MTPASYRAVDDVTLGILPAVAKAGELIPDSYVDISGKTLKVDFDHLVAIGYAELVDDKPKRKPKD